jgi:TnpA family transposase
VQREVNDGLHVMESWNGANDIIHFGKRGDIASNRRDEQELEILCLHILQAAMVYINTLMIQNVLGEPEWALDHFVGSRHGACVSWPAGG